jgi:O-antigen ligase
MPLFAIGFAVAYSSLLVLGLTKRPIFGLYAYLMAFYLHPPSRWWGEYLPDLRWSLISAVVTLAAVIINTKGKLIGFRFAEFWLFFLFSIFVVIQSFWAINTAAHLDYLVLMLNFCVLMLLIFNTLESDKDLVGFILANLIGCCYFWYLADTMTWSGRLDGVGGAGISSSNQMAQHVATVLFMGLYLLFAKGRRWYEYAAVLFLLTLVAHTILMAGSRGVYVSIAAASFLMVWYTPRLQRRRLYGLALVAIVGGSITVGQHIVDRFEGTRVDQSGEIADTSARSRIYIVKAQIEMWKYAPILGSGHMSTTALSPIYISKEYLTQVSGLEGGGRSSHNFFMTLLVDHGLLGASLFGLIIWRCVYRIRATSKLKVATDEDRFLQLLLLGLILSLILYMISGLFSDHNKGETDIWLYAIIPLFFDRLKRRMNAN